MSVQYDEMEKFLRDNGWKIYSKDGRKKLWESPHDGKKYFTQFAVSAQQIHDDEKREAARLKAQQDMATGLEEHYDKYVRFEVDVNKEFPPKRKRKTSKKVKNPKANREKILKDLGF